MTQKSRQAIIELLFLALYLDDFLTLAEDQVLSNALDALGWESATQREVFIFSAFSAAREVAGSGGKIHDFLDQRASQIRADGQEAAAMTWLHKILTSDGLSSGEKHFLSQLQIRLYPDSGL